MWRCSEWTDNSVKITLRHERAACMCLLRCISCIVFWKVDRSEYVISCNESERLRSDLCVALLLLSWWSGAASLNVRKALAMRASVLPTRRLPPSPERSDSRCSTLLKARDVRLNERGCSIQYESTNGLLSSGGSTAELTVYSVQAYTAQTSGQLSFARRALLSPPLPLADRESVQPKSAARLLRMSRPLATVPLPHYSLSSHGQPASHPPATVRDRSSFPARLVVCRGGGWLLTTQRAVSSGASA